MFNNKGAATAPQTEEALLEQFLVNENNVQMNIKSLVRKIEELKNKLAKMSKELFGTENFTEKKSFWPHVLLFLILLLVAGIEIPVNAMSFEIFDRNPEETQIMAIGFGFLIAVLAHFTGFSLKRAFSGEKNFYFIFFACIIIAGFAFYTTASFRLQYAEIMHRNGVLKFGQQFFFGVVMYIVGAIASFFHTSGVKNSNLEKVFKAELNNLRSTKIDLAKNVAKRDQLRKQYALDKAAIEQAKIDEIKQENEENKKIAKNEADQNEKSKNTAIEMRAEFEEISKKFDIDLGKAQVMLSDSTFSKAQMEEFIPYMEIKERLELLLADAAKVSSNETMGRLDEMNNQFNNLNA